MNEIGNRAAIVAAFANALSTADDDAVIDLENAVTAYAERFPRSDPNRSKSTLLRELIGAIAYAANVAIIDTDSDVGFAPCRLCGAETRYRNPSGDPICGGH